MLDIFKTAIAQLGAFGMLLSLFTVIVWQLRKDNTVKDAVIAGEIEKREKLLREVLDSHHQIASSLKEAIDGVVESVVHMQAATMRIEDKIDAKNRR